MTEDARDEQLGEALGVPPLDDVTRRRLVRNALEASSLGTDGKDGKDGAAEPPRARGSWTPLVAAAVVILLVVVGIVALGRGGNDSSSHTAARPADRAATAETPSAQATSGVGASLAPGTVDLGDLGDLSSAAARNRARAAVTVGPHADAGTGAVTPSVAEHLLRDVADAACADALRAGGTSIVGVGRATVDGSPAAVVVTETGGVRTASLLVLQPCALSPL